MRWSLPVSVTCTALLRNRHNCKVTRTTYDVTLAEAEANMNDLVAEYQQYQEASTEGVRIPASAQHIR